MARKGPRRLTSVVSVGAFARLPLDLGNYPVDGGTALNRAYGWGVFDGPTLGVPGALVRCPTCGQNTPDKYWQWLFVTQVDQFTIGGRTSPLADANVELVAPKRTGSFVAISWMRCGDEECDELIIRLHERTPRFDVPHQTTEEWIVRPREGASRPIDPAVPDHYRRDYGEAADTLNRSPRLSAVMARRILADLLHDYAGLVDYDLGDRVRKAVNNTSIPMNIRDNLEEFLQVGNYGAHRKKGRDHDEDVILDVGPTEAEWLLDLLDRMFGHFIVSKAKDDAMKKLLAEKKSIELPEQKKRT
jgi:hypothetical protein